MPVIEPVDWYWLDIIIVIVNLIVIVIVDGLCPVELTDDPIDPCPIDIGRPLTDQLDND